MHWFVFLEDHLVLFRRATDRDENRKTALLSTFFPASLAIYWIKFTSSCQRIIQFTLNICPCIVFCFFYFSRSFCSFRPLFSKVMLTTYLSCTFHPNGSLWRGVRSGVQLNCRVNVICIYGLQCDFMQKNRKKH